MEPFSDAFPAENIRHHFIGQSQSSGVYAKELHIPAGYSIVSHAHQYDHLSILAAGSVIWTTGETIREMTGPCALTVEAGIHHSLEALTDAVWFCIHPTDETDPLKADASVIVAANKE